MMKSRDFSDAQIIIDNLKIGGVGRRDLIALLIYIREHIPNDMIRDIAHCVAHSDRDRGYAYSHVEAFSANFISAAENGGILKVEPVFPRDLLVKEFAKDLIAIGFNVTQSIIQNPM
jgi:hypothetical protein